jgi:hypothetical protein
VNFLEAVAALQAGECEGIRRCSFTLKPYHVPGQRIGIDMTSGKIAFEHLLANDWQLVNPIPRTEKREVKRYLLVNKETGEERRYASNGDEAYDASVYEVVTLTGTYDSPIPRKTKKRGVYGGAIYANGVLQVNDPCEEIPIGKPLTLKIEWEENE